MSWCCGCKPKPDPKLPPPFELVQVSPAAVELMGAFAPRMSGRALVMPPEVMHAAAVAHGAAKAEGPFVTHVRRAGYPPVEGEAAHKVVEDVYGVSFRRPEEEQLEPPAAEAVFGAHQLMSMQQLLSFPDPQLEQAFCAFHRTYNGLCDVISTVLWLAGKPRASHFCCGIKSM